MLDGDVDAVADIITFCRDFLILLHIKPDILDHLLAVKAHEMIIILIENYVYFQRTITVETQKAGLSES